MGPQRTRFTRVRISLLYFLLYSRLRRLTRVAFEAAPPMLIAAAALRCDCAAGKRAAGSCNMKPAAPAKQNSSRRVLIAREVRSVLEVRNSDDGESPKLTDPWRTPFH